MCKHRRCGGISKSPESGIRTPPMSFSNVDFPPPGSPTIEINVPWLNSRLQFFNSPSFSRAACRYSTNCWASLSVRDFLDASVSDILDSSGKTIWEFLADDVKVLTKSRKLFRRSVLGGTVANIV